MADDRALDFSKTEESGNREGGKNYLLLIGIDKYAEVDPLQNAVRDAKGVANILLNRYQFEEENTLQLYDEDATRDKIISAFDVFAEKITEKDNLLIYYAGHGYFRKKLKLGYWIPVHAKEGKYSGFINHSLVRDYIQAIPAHHTLLIVDSCFSGNLLRGQGRELSETVVHANKVDRFPSRWCLAAGMIEKVSDGFIGDHSPFAQSLITFLKKNNETSFPVQDLVMHVSKATSYNSDQTPIGGVILKTGDENGQFVFNLKSLPKTEAIDWKEAEEQASKQSYQSFLKKWPAGSYAEEASYRLACTENNLSAYRTYLSIYQDKGGRYIEEVLDKMELLQVKRDFKHAIDGGEIALRRFILKEGRRDPASVYLRDAQTALEQLLKEQKEPQAWQIAENTGTEASYQKYLDEFPEGGHVAIAKNMIEDLQVKAEEKRKAQEVAKKRKEEEQAKAKKEVELARKRIEKNEKNFQFSLQEARVAHTEGKRKEALKYIKTALAYPSENKKEAEELRQQILKENPPHTFLKTRSKQQVYGISATLLGVIMLLVWSPWENRTPLNAGNSELLSPSPETLDNTKQANQATSMISIDTSQADSKVLADLPENIAFVKGGKFSMGNQFGEGGSNELPVHGVIVNSFIIGKHEVSFEEYDLYVKEKGVYSPNDQNWEREKRPVINISWLDAVKYCNWLSDQKDYTKVYTINGNIVSAKESANGYRLPTEAEWEYAAKGGNKNKDYKYAGSNKVGEVAWYYYNSDSKTQPIGSKEKGNELGLMDMSGNVWEWCWDWYGSDYYDSSPNSNPLGPDQGSFRVLRGGSWYGSAGYCRVSSRFYGSPGSRGYDVGFRLARSL